MKKAIIVLFLLNILALGLIFHLMTHSDSSDEVVETEQVGDAVTDSPEILEVDTVIKALPDNARIAYFFMDSIETGYKLISDRGKVYKSEAERLEKQVKRSAKRADARYKQLATADYTYSTQAEIEKVKSEMDNLLPALEKERVDVENQLARLELSMLQEVTTNLTDFLADYNEVQGLDFIYSIQPGGQIWVGNDGLDITEDVLNGLNHRYRKGVSIPDTASTVAN